MHTTPLLLALLTTLLPTALAVPKISVNVYQDTACAILDVAGYSFTKNNVCQQFIEQEGSMIATSKKPLKDGCVLQVFASTDCTDVLAAITPNKGCESPILGPASSGWLAGC